MKLGVQVGFGSGHIVLDADPAPLPRGAQPPIFGHMLWPKAAWIKMPLCMEVGFSPGDIVLDGERALLPNPALTNFRPISVVARRLCPYLCRNCVVIHYIDY